MKKVFAYSDGSSLGNPGPGGFGAILKFVDPQGRVHETEVSQGYRLTTNNRMELRGVIAIFEALKEPVDVVIYTDSQYVVNAFNQGWVESWIKKSWKKSDGKKVLNVDLWQELLELMKPHKTTFEWVKGHAGHEENERCDELAKAAAISPSLIDDEGYEP